MSARTIDVHAHVVPETCVGLVQAKAESQNFWGDMTDLDRRLADMDSIGVELQVISAWQGFFNQSLAIAAAFNDAIAAFAARKPDRLSALGVVPLGEPATAARETARLLNELGLKGVAIGSNVAGKGLDAPEFADFFAAAAELDCPIFIHPTNPLGADRLRDFELINLLGFVTDTALAAARLAMSGLLERHPALRIHLAHGGGSTGFLAGRWDHGWRERPAAAGASQPPSHYLKQLYVDSIVHSDEALEYAVRFWSADQIMLGTDYPYDMGMKNAVSWIQGQQNLSANQKDMILGGAARRFFKL